MTLQFASLIASLEIYHVTIAINVVLARLYDANKTYLVI